MTYITNGMSKFKPSESDEFFSMPNGERGRLIFENPIVLETEEEQYLNSFIEYIKHTKKAHIPEFYLNNDRNTLRVLSGYDYDFK